jgi:hypothetical protein
LGGAISCYKRSGVLGKVCRVHAATNQGRVGVVLGSQTSHEEGDFGGLGIAGKSDKGASDGVLEAVGPLCPVLAAVDLGNL